VGVGVVFHVILHHHEENVGALSDFLCAISHTANRLSARIRAIVYVGLAAWHLMLEHSQGKRHRA
jgi:hypothetical protein